MVQKVPNPGEQGKTEASQPDTQNHEYKIIAADFPGHDFATMIL